jgi:hypothetical protein
MKLKLRFRRIKCSKIQAEEMIFFEASNNEVPSIIKTTNQQTNWTSNHLANALNPGSGMLLEKLTVAQLVKTFTFLLMFVVTDAVSTSEMLANFCLTARRNNPEDSRLQLQNLYLQRQGSLSLRHNLSEHVHRKVL